MSMSQLTSKLAYTSVAFALYLFNRIRDFQIVGTNVVGIQTMCRPKLLPVSVRVQGHNLSSTVTYRSVVSALYLDFKIQIYGFENNLT